MQTNSFIINKIVAFFTLLNKYFKYSAIYSVFSAIGNAGKTSKVVGWFHDVFLSASKKNYYEGSFVLKFMVLIFSVIMINLKVFFNFLGKLNRTSVNKKIFDYFAGNLKSPKMLLKAVFAVLGGALALRASMAALLHTGPIAFTGYMCVSVIFFMLAFTDTEFWAIAVKGCFPCKMLIWFFDNE